MKKSLIFFAAIFTISQSVAMRVEVYNDVNGDYVNRIYSYPDDGREIYNDKKIHAEKRTKENDYFVLDRTNNSFIEPEEEAEKAFSSLKNKFLRYQQKAKEKQSLEQIKK